MKKMIFYHYNNKHEIAMANAFKEGMKKYNYVVDVQPGHDYKGLQNCDLAAVLGVKHRNSVILQQHKEKNIPCLYIDKGYSRSKSGTLGLLTHYRISVGDFQPGKYLSKFEHGEKRFLKLGIPIVPIRFKPKKSILFASSSQKYSDFHGLGNVEEYSESIIKLCHEVDRHKRKIIYRPKPSWKLAKPLNPNGIKTEFSHPNKKRTSFQQELKESSIVVTHGSNACWEALVNGVTCIVLGDGIVKDIVSNSIFDINNPLIPSPDQVHKISCDIAYQQWTLDEIQKGSAIEYLQRIWKDENYWK